MKHLFLMICALSFFSSPALSQDFQDQRDKIMQCRDSCEQDQADIIAFPGDSGTMFQPGGRAEVLEIPSTSGADSAIEFTLPENDPVVEVTTPGSSQGGSGNGLDGSILPR
ncbi:hypothetical protein [Shinella sp. M27]|uniref:hypothetical protein n=1 Tax=Shinella sp. M27 TaxID=3368614 RepID=UPI003BA0DE24